MEKNGDACSLRVALSMIDDWDNEFNSLFELEKPTGAEGRKAGSRGQRIAETAAPYKARRGDARKLEAHELRAQIDDLQRVVDAEKAKFVVERTEDSPEAELLRNEWERLATSQETQRFAAHVENEKLKVLVETQTKGAQKIVHLVQRVAQLERALPPVVEGSFEHYKGPTTDPREQLARLDRVREEAVHVFSRGAFADGCRKSVREVHLREFHPTEGGIEFTFQMAWRLPFSVDDVADALWVRATRLSTLDKVVQWLDMIEEPDIMVSQFISTPLDRDNHIISHGQVATHRYPKNTDDDSVLIMSTVQVRGVEDSSWKAFGEGDGWIRVERVHSHKPTPRTPNALSQVKWSRRVVMMPAQSESLSRNERAEWADKIINGPTRGGVEKALDWTIQAIENLLLTSKRRSSEI